MRHMTYLCLLSAAMSLFLTNSPLLADASLIDDDYRCESNGIDLMPPSWLDGREDDDGVECDWDDCQSCKLYGIWMPEAPLLFKPLMADPRQIVYSCGWRFNDEVLAKNVIDVSFGDTFPIYRWWNVFFCGDALQIDIEGGLWAVFDPLHYASPLVNADYYGGIPVTYAYGAWSARLRGFHISSHIGDEFLIDHPGFNRLNPSAEYIDFIVAYQLTDDIRVYGGYGNVIWSDDTFPVKPNYFEWGIETYLPMFEFYSPCNNLSGAPFFAFDFKNWQEHGYKEDSTYVLGYEFMKHTGLCRKARFYMEYHNGFSLEGQFCCLRSEYFALRASYGY